MLNETEKEFKTLMPGLTDRLRTGFVTAIIAMLLCAVIYLFILVIKLQNQKEEMQAKLYEQMIDYLRPTKDRLNNVADKADTAATRVIEAAKSIEVTNTKDSLLKSTITEKK